MTTVLANIVGPDLLIILARAPTLSRTRRVIARV